MTRKAAGIALQMCLALQGIATWLAAGEAGLPTKPKLLTVQKLLFVLDVLDPSSFFPQKQASQEVSEHGGQGPS